MAALLTRSHWNTSNWNKCSLIFHLFSSNRSTGHAEFLLKSGHATPWFRLNISESPFYFFLCTLWHYWLFSKVNGKNTISAVISAVRLPHKRPYPRWSGRLIQPIIPALKSVSRLIFSISVFVVTGIGGHLSKSTGDIILPPYCKCSF